MKIKKWWQLYFFFFIFFFGQTLVKSQNFFNFVFLFREYLATFKKTVAMHEVFLQRTAAHPLLRNDVNFEVFLEFSGDVSLLICFFFFLLIGFNRGWPVIAENALSIKYFSIQSKINVILYSCKLRYTIFFLKFDLSHGFVLKY